MPCSTLIFLLHLSTLLSPQLNRDPAQIPQACPFRVCPSGVVGLVGSSLWDGLHRWFSRRLCRHIYLPSAVKGITERARLADGPGPAEPPNYGWSVCAVSIVEGFNFGTITMTGPVRDPHSVAGQCRIDVSPMTTSAQSTTVHDISHSSIDPHGMVTPDFDQPAVSENGDNTALICHHV